MSTFFIGYITLQVFCKGRNIAVNVSAQNNNGYKNEKKVLCLSFVVEIKREPERNHLSCVTVKTDHNEVSSVKMELHWNIEEFQWTLAYNSRFTRLPLRFVAASPLDSPPLFPTPLLSRVTSRTVLRYMATCRTNQHAFFKNYGKYVSIDIVLCNQTWP